MGLIKQLEVQLENAYWLESAKGFDYGKTLIMQPTEDDTAGEMSKSTGLTLEAK